MWYLLLFLCNNSCTNAPHCYTLYVLCLSCCFSVPSHPTLPPWPEQFSVEMPTVTHCCTFQTKECVFYGKGFFSHSSFLGEKQRIENESTGITLGLFLELFFIPAFLKQLLLINWLYFSIQINSYNCSIEKPVNVQGGSNMTGTDLHVNKPHCAAAVRP